MNNSELLSALINGLKKGKGADGMATAKIVGINFAAADIALKNNDGQYGVYRIVVVKHA